MHAISLDNKCNHAIPEGPWWLESYKSWIFSSRDPKFLDNTLFGQNKEMKLDFEVKKTNGKDNETKLTWS